jgi:hypothetical protein
MTSDHAKAVLFLCDQLTAASHSVISANTDEKTDPQIFAQSDAGVLAFYFVRAGTLGPSAADFERFRALAARHEVAAYYAPVTLFPQPVCRELIPL